MGLQTSLSLQEWVFKKNGFSKKIRAGNLVTRGAVIYTVKRNSI